MKKHLLFATMLAISAAPAAASQSASSIFVITDDVATPNFESLMKNIADFKQTLTTLLATLQEKYPDAETPISTVKTTLNGEGGLAEMEKEANAKHEDGSLTAEDIKAYQAILDKWTATFTEESIIGKAQQEQWTADIYAAANKANEEIETKQGEISEDVATYFNSIIDGITYSISTVSWYLPKTLTEDDVKDAFAKIDAYKAQADEALANAATAGTLVAGISESLKTVDEQVKLIKEAGLECDEETIQETKEYWQGIADGFKKELGEDEEPVTKDDLDEMTEDFGYFADEAKNLYNRAQSEAWQGEYNSKYMAISNRITEITSILDSECKDVAEKYMSQLEDLNAEMTQASMLFYGDEPITKAQFDGIMNRAGEIATEIEDILAQARKEASGSETPSIDFDTLAKNIADFKQTLTTLLATLQEKYPDAETPISAVETTLNGEGGLADMEKEANAKHEAGSLTAEDIKAYQATLDDWTATFTEEKVIGMAQQEQWVADIYAAANKANEEIGTKQSEISEDVATYFNSIIDGITYSISTVSWYLPKTLTEDDVKDAFAKIDAYKAQADEALANAATAGTLVAGISESLKTVDEQVKLIKEAGLECDEETIQETKEYWQGIADGFKKELGEDEEPVTKDDLDEMTEDFGYFADEAKNLYNRAQSEAWQGEYNSKYMAISNRITEITSILDSECKDVAEKYMSQLEDLNAEMTQASMLFYGDEPITKAQFDAIMTRAGEIATEIEDILAQARKEMTGVEGIAVESQSAKSAHTLSGAKVNAAAAAKGIYIVNGKKILMK